MRWLVVVLLVSSGCSTAPPPVPEVKAAVAPHDESRRFAAEGQVKSEVIPEHLLGKSFMPGGNLVTYHAGKSDYQEFLGAMPDAQSASFLLLDWKKELHDAEYLPEFGGYFGTDGGRPVFVFVKKAWVAGIVGLPKPQADKVARQFATEL